MTQHPVPPRLPSRPAGTAPDSRRTWIGLTLAGLAFIVIGVLTSAFQDSPSAEPATPPATTTTPTAVPAAAGWPPVHRIASVGDTDEETERP